MKKLLLYGKSGRQLFAVSLSILLLVGNMPLAEAQSNGVQVREIPLSDVNRSGKPISSCWGGIGIDHNKNVYIAMGLGKPDSDDVGIFQYNSDTGQRRLLDTLKNVTQSEGNYDANETIAKVHADIQEFNGKMYLSSHDFHDLFAGKYHRGGHFFSYDPSNDRFEDLSKTDPGGVSAPGQGIIAMDIMKGQNKLVGFTFPEGDVVSYDLVTRRSSYFNGNPNPDNGVSRHIFTTDDGKAYISYGQWAGPQPIYAMDISNGGITNTGYNLRLAQIPAEAHSADGDSVYLLNWDYLYVFHKGQKQLEDLGSLLPPGEQGSQLSGSNLVLSNNGEKLYSIAEGSLNGNGPYTARLYEFDLQTRQSRQIADLTSQVLSLAVDGRVGSIIGGTIDSQGRIYTCGSEGFLIEISAPFTRPQK
jgi:hypothetical protein